MNKAEAIVFLKSAGVKISVRTLQRHVSKGDLSVAYVRGPKGDEADFDDAELRRFAERLTSKTYVTRATHDNGAGTAGTAQSGAGGALVRTRDAFTFRDLLDAIDAAKAASPRPAPTILDIAHKLTLSLAEAAQLSGLSRAHLRAAIEEKKLKARIIGRGFKVKRSDLEAYVSKL